MAPRDQQIRLGDGDAPQSYTVPNAVELIPLSINAVFDGSGAAGAFVPTVEIISDGGVVVARVPCQTAVAAGDSAEVTFAPFLRNESTASTTTATPAIATFYRGGGDASLTVQPETVAPSPGIPWLHAALPSGTSYFSGFTSGDDTLYFAQPCITIEYLYTQWDSPGYLKAAVIGTDSRITESDQYSLGNAGSGAATTVNNYGDSTQYVRPNAHLVNDSLVTYASNGDTVNHTITAAYLVIYIWPAPGYNGNIPGWPQ